ncbi:MAG: MBL fold metallo-hydrolase [Deltaproteobacteria bacterium]|jgi:glyoxylase-like metal-dependent hydrolase (beta-lactamase superfamily II)|nr:MBL fold metallo-hydrolase [Deltaproteobacteria bacterium]MBT4638896.1 MBL fold metallo-hydrolase [Deltaproteobacteria bacterium]MBT6504793.1 MBL fold metallo-hydrolase [Deltaproteobacteria bacterium]MBT7152722.1 MBL fold metallo-hydrolase [Deltaproteobacteria bacterium]MBT7712899.1 MBL fold metallo-hydrolase [Deltaproteobacteria bacterium]
MDTTIPFKREFSFEYGKVEQLSPMIRRVVANNPNFFTFYGTNTYILGSGNVALVDPGPDLAEHIDAIVGGLKGEVITHILVTHSHFDHWPGYVPLQIAFGAKTYGYIPGSQISQNLVEESEDADALSNQERFEGTGFTPDVGLGHGDILEGDGWSLESVFTPGHSSNHMCFQLREEKALFSGDHVMGWSTSVISPPSGNMEDYMNSLELLLQRDDMQFWPAHGPGIDDPKSFVQSFIDHRLEREQEILVQLKKGVDTIHKMVPYIYKDIPEMLHPAAERSTLAAVIYMKKRGVISCAGDVSVRSALVLK